MCIVVACVVAFGSAVSCFCKPLKASAVDADLIKESITHYITVFNNNYSVALQAFQHDLNNGTFDATSSLARQAGKQVMLQYLNMMTLNGFGYDDMWNVDWNNLPNSISFSGHGTSGFYISALDNNIHVVSFSEPIKTGLYNNINAELGFSDEFIYGYNYSPHSPASGGFSVESIQYSYHNFRIMLSTTSSYSLDCKGLTSNYFNWSRDSVTFNLNSSNLYRIFTSVTIDASSDIQVLSRNASLSTYQDYNKNIGWCGIEYDLPEGSIDSISPWDYYNNILLPQLIQFFNDNHVENYDKYLVFPEGYTPPLQPDPTEPGTMPSGGISIGSNNNIDIDINVYYPTDESGQPVTDESGETVTETYYVTDTTPTDVVYKFTIPTLPNLDRYSDTLHR